MLGFIRHNVFTLILMLKLYENTVYCGFMEQHVSSVLFNYVGLALCEVGSEIDVS